MSELVFPNQRNSTSEKMNKVWYTKSSDYVIGSCLSNTDMTEISRLLNAADGVYDEDTFRYVLTPYGDSANEFLKDLKLPGEIRNTSIITPIIEKKMGRYLLNMPKFQVVVNDADVVEKYNDEFAAKIGKYAMQLVIAKLNEAGVNTGQQTPNIEELKKEIQTFKENYLDDRVKQGQAIMDAIWNWTDSELLYTICYYDFITTGRCFDYREIINDEFIKEAIRPLEYFDINNGSMFCEDRDMQTIRKRMSFNSILDRFGFLLSNTDIEYIRKLSEYGINDSPRISVPIELIRDRNNYIYPEFGRSTTATSLDLTDGNGDLFVYTAIWKTECKKGILSRIGELNQLEEIVVEDDYELQPEVGDIHIEWKWITKYFRTIRIGEPYVGITINAGYLPIQSYDIGSDTPKSCINGKVGLFNFMSNQAITKRLTPYDILHAIYGFQIERMVSKAVNTGSITFIPASLLGSDKLEQDKNWYFAAVDGRMILDDSESPNVNVAAQLLKVSDSGLGKCLSDLMSLRVSIKEEAWDSIGWNRQIDGQINSSDLKSNTNTAINIAIHSGILVDEIFNKFVEKSLQKDIDYSKVWLVDYDKNISAGSYRNSDNEILDLVIDGEVHASTTYGLFVRNNAREQKRLDAYKDLAFAAAQGGEYEMAAIAIDTENANVIKKSVLEFSAKKREFEQMLEQNRLENDRLITDSLRNSEEADRQTKLVIADMGARNNIDVALIRESNNYDVASNIADASKKYNDDRKHELDRLVADRDYEVKKEGLKLKNKDLDIKLKVAKENKNKYDNSKNKKSGSGK